MRKRTTAASRDSQNEKVEPIDEDDQQAVIDKLAHESTRQQAHMDKAFGYLCMTAAVTCLAAQQLLMMTSMRLRRLDVAQRVSLLADAALVIARVYVHV